VLLTCEWHAAPHTEFLVFVVPVAHHSRVRVPARATGAKPKDPPRRTKPSVPLKSSQVNTLPIAKSPTRRKQNKDIQKFV
jgi:hypothetical protein